VLDSVRRLSPIAALQETCVNYTFPIPKESKTTRIAASRAQGLLRANMGTGLANGNGHASAQPRPPAEPSDTRTDTETAVSFGWRQGENAP